MCRWGKAEGLPCHEQESSMSRNEFAERYYSRILSARRLNGPSFAEATRDLAAIEFAVFNR
jgi:hypothetical protein